MSQMKSAVTIIMGIIILVADVSWLVVGSSYTYLPWLALGIVIFVATIVWIGIDYSLMRGSQSSEANMEKKSGLATKK